MFCIYVDVWILKESLFVYAVQVWGKSMSNIKMKMDFCMWHTAVKPHSADRQQMITFMLTSAGFGHLQLCLIKILMAVCILCVLLKEWDILSMYFN